jgi:hypothetical protein
MINLGILRSTIWIENAMSCRDVLLACSLAVSSVCAPWAYADEWGCEVLLCLSNPNGPTAVKECEPPIRKLWIELAKPHHTFPSCELSSSSNGATYAAPTTNYYDACPAGTAALAAITSQSTDVLTGIGSGEGVYPFRGDSRMGKPTAQDKVCVSGYTGDKFLINNGNRYAVGVNTGVYQQVVVLNPNRSGQLIEVFIDGQLYRQVRY